MHLGYQLCAGSIGCTDSNYNKHEQMNPQELRLGNIVFDDYTKENKEVFSIEENSIWVGPIGSGEHNQRCPIESIHPIKLTNDWFKKFGAAEYDHLYYCWTHDEDHDTSLFNLHGIELYKNHEQKEFVWYDIDGLGDLVKAPQFVHELQNLYFVFNGTELKLIPQ
jgi:hypothetical protein